VCLSSYNSESYLCHRAAPCSRRGFGGNYRRRSPRPAENFSTPTRSPTPTSAIFDASSPVPAGEVDDDGSRWHHGSGGTQSMPGTLDRRYGRERRTQFNEALLAKAAADLSLSCHTQTASDDQSAASPASALSSSGVVEPATVKVDNSSSNQPNNEVDVSHRREEGTAQMTADITATDSVDAQDLARSSSEPAADGERMTTVLRGDTAARQRRWCSDESTSTYRCRRKEFTAVGRRRCRSLERQAEARHRRGDEATSSAGAYRSGDLVFGGTIRKSDSFDSGIDTKSESTSPRSAGTDDVTVDGLNNRPDVASSRSVDASSSTRRDAAPEVLPLSAAEVEYDRKSATLVRHLGDDEAELRRVLSSSCRVPSCYMSGVFDDVVRPLSSKLDEANQCSELPTSDDRSTAAEELKV